MGVRLGVLDKKILFLILFFFLILLSIDLLLLKFSGPDLFELLAPILGGNCSTLSVPPKYNMTELTSCRYAMYIYH